MDYKYKEKGKKPKKENYKPKMNLKGKNSVKSQKPVKENTNTVVAMM